MLEVESPCDSSLGDAAEGYWETVVTLSIRNAQHRLICHGVCEYYTLHSHSETVLVQSPSGEETLRAVVVRHRRHADADRIPELSLAMYLRTQEC